MQNEPTINKSVPNPRVEEAQMESQFISQGLYTSGESMYVPSGEKFERRSRFGRDSDRIIYASNFRARYCEGVEEVTKGHTIRALVFNHSVIDCVRLKSELQEKIRLTCGDLNFLLMNTEKYLATRGKNVLFIPDSGGGDRLAVCIQMLTSHWKVYTMPIFVLELGKGDRVFVTP
jgi:hypothetical protein